jgi:hypothetical protein
MKKFRKTCLLMMALVMTAASVFTVHAAEVDTSQAPIGQAPAQMKEFGALVGNWEATSTRFLPDGTINAQYNGRWEIGEVDDGRMIFDAVTWFTKDGKVKFYDATLRTFIPKTNQWEMVWLSSLRPIHSKSFRGQFINGEGHFDIVVSLSPERSVIAKIRFYNFEKDSFEWSMENSTDGGKSWFISERISAKRIR